MSVLEPGALVAARQAIDHEADTLGRLGARLGDQLARALEVLIACAGTVVVSGLGKSGHIGAKISATLASTGTHSMFLHATEALHGDAGRLRPGDVLVALSHSGTTEELLAVCDLAADRAIPIVAVTGNPAGPLAARAVVVLDTSVDREADPLDLVPTSSTTAALAVGDALAVGLMAQRRFSAEDFARHHPAGALGRRLGGGS